MKTIVLKSTNNQYRVEIKTDLLTNSGAFTVMEIVGKSDAEVVAGMNIREVATSFEAVKAFAQTNNLLMDIIDVSKGTTTAVVNSVTALSMTSTGALAGGTDGTPYNQPIVVVGGNGPFTFEVTAGDLPSGLFLSAKTGKITGTPDTVENPTFTVTVTDAFGQTDNDATLSIDIEA